MKVVFWDSLIAFLKNNNMKNFLKKFVEPKVFLIEKNKLIEFDEKFYLEKNADVKKSKLSAIQHFINYGFKEARIFKRGVEGYQKNDQTEDALSGIDFGPLVGFLVECFDNGLPKPCSAIRLINPLRELQGLRELRCEKFSTTNISQYDFIVTNRVALNEQIVETLLREKTSKTKIIYDIDDFLWESYSENSSEFRRSIELGFLIADIVMVSTTSLQKKVFEDFGVDSVVIRNASHFVRRSSSKNANKIFYFGTRTHQKDWELVEGALLEVVKSNLNLEICILGGLDHGYSPPSFVKIISDSGLYDYEEFIKSFAAIDSILIGVVPLCGIEFNEYKSAIKFHDYQMLCKYVVASNVGEYREIDDPRLIKVNQNSHEEWVKAIKYAVNLALQDSRVNDGPSGKIDRLNNFNSLFSSQCEQKKIARKGFELLSVGSTRQIIFNKYFNGNGIEIGALHNPLKVSSRVSVKYLDRLDRDGLYSHYPELKNLNLVDVDIVDDGEKLSSISNASLDFIIANHMLEHCRNPIGTLINFQNKLKSGGLVYLAVPDCRYTFDVGRDHTSLDHLLEDFENDGADSEVGHYEEWVRICEKNIGYQHQSEEAIQLRIQKLMNMKYSIHYHAWTSEEFVSQLIQLADQKTINFRIIDAVSIGDEMIVILEKSN